MATNGLATRPGAWRLFAVVAVLTASALSTASLEAHRRYLQPKILSELARATKQLELGNYDEAEARLNLVVPNAPLAVSLDTPGMTLAERVEAENALTEALRIWQDETGGQAVFQVVPRDFAQVRVKWTSGQVYGGRCAGHAVWSRQAWSTGGKFHSELSADIEMAMRDSDGEKLPAPTLAQAAAHELGHILGMDDTGHKGDLMGPVRIDRPVLALSPKEREAMDDLRAEALGLSALCAEHRSLVSW